jgi:hypothetical protein
MSNFSREKKLSISPSQLVCQILAGFLTAANFLCAVKLQGLSFNHAMYVHIFVFPILLTLFDKVSSF